MLRTPNLPLSNPITLIATWFGSGLSPKAPGTAGSLAALPFIALIQYFTGNFGVLIFALLAFFGGWWATHHYTKGGAHDPQEVVIDEVSGQALVLSCFMPSLASYLIGFALFRLFDIWKPGLIKRIDRDHPTAFGVMLDDTLAAIFAIGVMALLVIIGQGKFLSF